MKSSTTHQSTIVLLYQPTVEVHPSDGHVSATGTFDSDSYKTPELQIPDRNFDAQYRAGNFG